MKFKDIVPLIGVVLPTLVIGYGFVIPNSVIAGVNELSIGFGTTSAVVVISTDRSIGL
jgi:hypothetical protein